MNVLLINPNRERMPWPVMPIGLCLVASALRRAGHDVELLDLTFSRRPYRDTLAAVRRRAPELVGITIRNIDNCNFENPVFYPTEIRDTVMRAVRRGAPGVPIVIGGAGVNVAAWDLLHYLEADYALVGEGEQALPRLIDALQAGKDVLSLPGTLAWNGPAPVVDTAPAFGNDRTFRHEPASGRALVADLDTNPLSDAHRWVDVRRYAADGAPYAIQTKRGCALRCVYCVYNNIEGRRYRLRSPSLIADEVELLVSEHGVRQIDIVDSTFNLPSQHALELCDELAARKHRAKLSTMGVNPAATSPELLAAMKRAGFTSLMCTPESASDVTLKSLQKGYQRDAVVRAAGHLRQAGIKTFWFFMFGAPGETIETVRETLDFCEREIPPSDVVLFTTGIRVYAGTPLEKQLKAQGCFAPDDPLLEPSWYISPDVDLAELYGMLVRAAAAHPNWMTNAETILRPMLATVMKRGFRMVGWRNPFWTYLPRVFSVTSRLGFRGRQLAANHDRVTRAGRRRLEPFRGWR